MRHYGYDAEQGCYTGYPTAEQEHDHTELGERVVLEFETERDRVAGWPVVAIQPGWMGIAAGQRQAGVGPDLAGCGSARAKGWW